MAAWEGFQRRSALPGSAKLVVDPCGHCQAAASLFPDNLIFGRVLLPILMAFDMMSNSNMTNRTWPPVPEAVDDVTFYVMGADESGAPGNHWTSLPDFPAPTPTTLFLAADGALAPSAPPAGTAPGAIVYNPANPVPTIGGNNLEIACGPLDQRPIEKAARADVLIFTTPPLDAPLAVVGELRARLHFSTDVVDTDLVVKLIDVYPANSSNPAEAGRSILVADGIARARWRGYPAGGNEPQLLSGDTSDTYEIDVSLWRTAYVFAEGHSLRVHVASSNYPRFFPNDNLGTPMATAKGPGGPNATAHTALHLEASRASSITLPVVPLAALPKFPVEEAVDSMLARHSARWEGGGARSRAPGDVDMRAWLQRRVAAALGAAADSMRGGLEA